LSLSNGSQSGSPLIAPDSRAKSGVGAKWTPHGVVVPIYCAQCAKPGGYVPEENMTFVAWLCDDCYHTHGDVFAGMVIPDEVFWAELAAAQQMKYGHTLTEAEVIAKLADPASLESTLARSRGTLTPAPPSL
jgi:hypothetical protein